MEKSGSPVGIQADEVAETSTVDLKVPDNQCRLEASPDPCTLVIMGASGDLAKRKLVPALFSLFCQETLPRGFLIVGAGRTEFSNQDFRKKMKIAVGKKASDDPSKWTQFEAKLHYRSVNYDAADTFNILSQQIDEIEAKHKVKKNRIYYLAVPPSLIEGIVTHMGQTGLSQESGGNWTRLVVEKPFGRDLPSAVNLDRLIHRHFQEHQIFRIDHYLAKETVQNILMFRFANAIFEPVWNRNYVDHIKITAMEDSGVGHRAGYYEQAGVLRDMFQNHMMQLLALTAMEPPTIFETSQVRDEKVKIFRSIKPFSRPRLNEHLILGQYGPGQVAGEAVPGYRDEPGVSPDSLVPTFAMLKIYLDNWRWQGVPFYLASGKRMEKKITEIVVQFKEVPHSLFQNVFGAQISANRLVLSIYPEEKITLTFQTKNPGAKVCLRSVTMNFFYHQDFHGPVMEAYEKVLLDCMLGDQMLFWRQDGVELCWSFLTPILKECETCGDRARMLFPYAAGTCGPDKYVELMKGL